MRDRIAPAERVPLGFFSAFFVNRNGFGTLGLLASRVQVSRGSTKTRRTLWDDTGSRQAAPTTFDAAVTHGDTGTVGLYMASVRISLTPRNTTSSELDPEPRRL